MKKIVALMLMFCVGMGAVQVMASDKSERKEKKEWRQNAEKLAKKQAKILKKEKWLTNSTVPLENALINYYLATAPECGGKKRGVTNEANNCKSISLGERRTLTAAQNTYVQEMQAIVIGEIAEHSASRNEDGDEVTISDVKTKIKDELQGDVTRAFTLYKVNKDGTYWVRSYFIIDTEGSAAKLRDLSRRLDKDEDISRSIKRAADGLE